MSVDPPKSVLEVWAIELNNSAMSGSTLKDVTSNILWHINQPRIIAALFFEAKMGSYFETTMKWHSQKGLLYNPPGFSIFEIMGLYFDFIMPFWSQAMADPKSHFSTTMKYINGDAFSDDEQGRLLKKNQVKLGISAGFNELSKMLKLLLSPPLLYLLLCDGQRGPNFMVAVVRLIADNSVELAQTLDLGSVFWPSTCILPNQTSFFAVGVGRRDSNPLVSTAWFGSCIHSGGLETSLESKQWTGVQHHELQNRISKAVRRVGTDVRVFAVNNTSIGTSSRFPPLRLDESVATTSRYKVYLLVEHGSR
jgi:hypothetical protein